MKASCVLAILCGVEILGAFLHAAAHSIDNPDSEPDTSVAPTSLALTATTREVIPLTLLKNVHNLTANTLPPVSDAKPTTTNPTTTVTTATPSFNIYRKECLSHLMVSGGLIIVCFILLMCMLVLTCRVCQLTRRIRALGSRDELVSNSGYWTGTGKKNKSKPAAEAKETSMLMADMGNGAAKEEQGEAAQAGEKGEQEPAKEEEREGEQKEEGKAAAGGGEEEAAAGKEEDTTPAEDSSTPEQQEEVADSQPAETTQAPTSEQPNESV